MINMKTLYRIAISLTTAAIIGLNILGFSARSNNLEAMVKSERSPKAAYCHRLEFDDELFPLYYAPPFLLLQAGPAITDKKFREKYNLQSLNYPEGCEW